MTVTSHQRALAAVSVIPILAIALFSSAARGEIKSGGILPVAGTPSVAARLDQALGRTVAERGMRAVVGPLELRLRIASRPEIKKALAAAKKHIAAAKSASLYMKRKSAVNSARAAIAELERSAARFHSPALLGGAHGALALALMLDPADPKGALLALRRAVAVDSAYRPDTDRLDPAAATLLGRARKENKVTAPASAALAQVASFADRKHLIWISALKKKTTVALEVLVYDAEAKAIRAHLRQNAKDGPTLVDKVASLIAAALVGMKTVSASQPLATTLPEKIIGPQPGADDAGDRPAVTAAVGSQITKKSVSRPWYKKWWIWTIAGVVTASAAVVVGVSLSKDKKASGWTFEFK